MPRICDAGGKEIISNEGAVLCRCGSSGKKPFCDGSHTSSGFTGEKSPERQPDKVDVYEGKNITIYDNRGVCSHRGYCTDELPSVWHAGQEPWINPEYR